MDKVSQQDLRMALGILSGRCSYDRPEVYEALGYNIYMGDTLSETLVMDSVEEIVFNAIVYGTHDE